MLFIETPIFTELILNMLGDEEYRELQRALLMRPDTGVIIPGGGGLRKVRWRVVGRGKSGGLRIIYYWDKPAERFYMLFIYRKNQQEDLTSRQIRVLRQLVEEYLA